MKSCSGDVTAPLSVGPAAPTSSKWMWTHPVSRSQIDYLDPVDVSDDQEGKEECRESETDVLYDVPGLYVHNLPVTGQLGI